MALIAIRHRQTAFHRQSMARSYIVTYGFVVFPRPHAFPVVPRPRPRGISGLRLALLAVPLLLAEITLQFHTVTSPRR